MLCNISYSGNIVVVSTLHLHNEQANSSLAYTYACSSMLLVVWMVNSSCDGALLSTLIVLFFVSRDVN